MWEFVESCAERKNEQVIAALLATSSIREAAAVANCHENTVAKLLQKPEFADQYKIARQELLRSTLDKLQAINAQAVECLATVMSSAKSPASAKVSAARTTLEMSLRIIEIVDVTERLAAIERKVMISATN